MVPVLVKSEDKVSSINRADLEIRINFLKQKILESLLKTKPNSIGVNGRGLCSLALLGSHRVLVGQPCN